MRDPVKLLGFSLWLFFLNCAQCQDITCTAPVIPNGYVDQQLAIYKKDAILKYKCYQGFKPREGIPRCVKFGWTLKPECDEVTCELKSIKFGVKTISPVGQTIFRAGEKVEITCSEKYWFSSKDTIKEFNCLDNGEWNFDPVCKEIRCEALHDQNEYGIYRFFQGSVKLGEEQSYSCRSGYRKTAEVATCTRDGWTPKPLCTAIMCADPNIPNAEIVGDKSLNNKIYSTIYYKCNPGFEPEQPVRIICDPRGRWRGIQQCTEVTCELKSIKFGVKKISPVGQTIFRAGEKVEITCSEKYWFLFSKDTSKEFTCLDNGEWDSELVCEDIRCEALHDQNEYGISSFFQGSAKLGEKQPYSCRSGYRKTADVATCTRDGWTPKPLCAEIMCADPNIPNAEIVGDKSSNNKIYSRIYYKCNPGFEPEQPVRIICDSQGRWRGIRRCTAMCAAPYIPNAEIVGDPILKYNINSKIKYKCSPGFEPEEPVQITCDSQGQWTEIQKCTEKTCAAPNIPNAEILRSKKQAYRSNSGIEYKCHPGFEPEEPVKITCGFQGQWTGIQECTEGTCQLESITSGVKRIIPEGQTVFKVGESVEFICSEKSLFHTVENSKSFTCQHNGKWNSKPGCEITCEVPHDQHVSGPEYHFSGETKLGAKRSYGCKSGYRQTATEATCTQDGWTPKPLCAEMTCDPPRVPNAEIMEGQRINYKTDSRIKYKCNPGFEPEEPVSITCDSQGHWTGIQQCTDGTCQEQELKNIEILFGYPTTTSPYKPGHILVFRCTDDNMRFYGQPSIKCQSDGRWNYPYPQCGGTVQCSKPTKHLQFVTLSDEKTEYSNSETLTYTCNKPYNDSTGGVLMCHNGNWNGTYDCRSKICPPPPYLQHGDYSIKSKTDEVITAVSYTCQSYYVLTKQQEVYKCLDGKWETPPKCLRPCEIDDIVEKYNLQLPTGKVYIKHAEKYRLNCRDGWHTGSEIKAYVDVLCSDGNLQIDKSCNTQNDSK